MNETRINRQVAEEHQATQRLRGLSAEQFITVAASRGLPAPEAEWAPRTIGGAYLVQCRVVTLRSVENGYLSLSAEPWRGLAVFGVLAVKLSLSPTRRVTSRA